tara:strand:- start:8391 stop:8567 length:177 start_codon:yes stop_codon:yes gene_type:complete
MLIDTEKEHGRRPVRKTECDSPAIGKSHFPIKATLSWISKEQHDFSLQISDIRIVNVE